MAKWIMWEAFKKGWSLRVKIEYPECWWIDEEGTA